MNRIIIFLLILGTLGCQSAYMRDRSADLADIVDLAIPVEGSALLVQVGVGPLKLGVGHNSTCFYGLLAGRWGTHCIDEQNYLFFSQKLKQESLFYDYRFTFRGKRASIRWSDFQGQEEWTKTGVFLWGVAGFNPGELADFLLGVFGFDIYDDDYYRHREMSTTRMLELKSE